jgi:hypothetical protein
MIWLFIAAFAGDSDPNFNAAFHGDVKSFFTATFPYDSAFMPDSAGGQGVLNTRAKLDLGYKELLDFQVHHAVSAMTAPAFDLGGGGGFGSTGVTNQAPEAVELSWTEPDDDTLTILGRTDRLVLTAHLPQVDIALGRQPISFGNGMFFTPLDLVNPFTPATIDTEYKPGVDAARVDAYVGMSRFTIAAAYAGDWDLEGSVLAAYGQGTVGVTDLGFFFGEVHADEVLGATVSTSVGAVGITSDLTLTLPADPDLEDAFVRGVVGTFFRPTGTTTMTAEFYVQSNGNSDAADILTSFASDRVLRGELWTFGRFYGGVSVSQEISGLVHGNLAILANLEDPSALLLPSVSWSVASNADVSAGAYVALGKRPDGFVPQSEFGLYPATGFVAVKTYF